MASFNALRDNPVTTTEYLTAEPTTKLSELTALYNTEGVFMVDQPQTLTLIQGDGKTTSIMLYPTDTIEDVRQKLNDAVAYGLGQSSYAQADKFVSFVTEEQNNGLETVAGTFIIRSAVPGSSGEITITGDEELINALALNTIQESTDSTLTASVYDAHSGKPIVSNVKAFGPEFVSLIPPDIDIEVDSMSALSANWDDNTKKFILAGKNVYSAFIHLKNNGTVFQTGANSGEDFMLELGDSSSSALGLSRVNVSTRENASRSVSILDRAINAISSQRAKIGSYSNSLEHIMTDLTAYNANLTNADSRLRDADMASEMMGLVKYQILNQSGTSMLAQANQLPNSVLSLMGN